MIAWLFFFQFFPRVHPLPFSSDTFFFFTNSRLHCQSLFDLGTEQKSIAMMLFSFQAVLQRGAWFTTPLYTISQSGSLMVFFPEHSSFFFFFLILSGSFLCSSGCPVHSSFCASMEAPPISSQFPFLFSLLKEKSANSSDTSHLSLTVHLSLFCKILMWIQNWQSQSTGKTLWVLALWELLVFF